MVMENRFVAARITSTDHHFSSPFLITSPDYASMQRLPFPWGNQNRFLRRHLRG
jgi:hypothetical protein